MRKTRPLHLRFWEKVDKDSSPHGCWLWIGSVSSGGHGKFYVDGHLIQAHRVAWEMKYGLVLPGFFVCHDCPGGDNPRCVNPDHLFIGTNSDNILDAVSKGTFPTGDRHYLRIHPEKIVRGEAHYSYTTPSKTARGAQYHRSPLTDADVYIILSLRGTFPARIVAEQYNVSGQAIYDIWQGRTWTHVTYP